MLVTHFTRSNHVAAIQHAGVIKLENCNVKVHTQYTAALGGEYVWFTEQAHAYNSVKYKHTHHGFQFNTDTTPGLQRWTDRLRELPRNAGNQRIIDLMHFTARVLGDDPTTWWVSQQPVSLAHCLNPTQPTVYTNNRYVSYSDMLEQRRAFMLKHKDSYWSKVYMTHTPTEQDWYNQHVGNTVVDPSTICG